MAHVASVSNAIVSRSGKDILGPVSFTLSEGERWVILGPNGAGKSTFLQMLQGHEPADSGKINIGDTVIFGNFSQQGLEINEWH